jgi:hypothetical protein
MATDNRYQLNDCEANTGWSGDDTANAIATAGSFIEGAGALATQLSNADEQMHTTEDSTATGTYSFDLSAATLYCNVKDNLHTTFALGGMTFVVGDGTDLVGYDTAGNDAVGFPGPLYFHGYKMDLSVHVASPGTNIAYTGTEANLAQTTITQVGYGSLHLAKAVGSIDNVIMDGFYYILNTDYALTIDTGTVGTPETMADVLADDIAAGMVLVNNPKGKEYGFFGSTEFGTPSGTADSYFVANDEQWYLVGDNGGGHAAGTGNFIFRTIGNSTGTNSIVLTRVTLVSTGTRATFDFSNNDMGIVQIASCVFNDIDGLVFPIQVANDRFVNSSVFNNCGQIDFQSIDSVDCIFNGTTAANGAIVWDETTGNVPNQDDFTFNSDGTGNAIEVAPTGAGPFTYNIDGYSFDAYAGQSGTAANRIFYLNPSTLSADITINLTNSAVTNAVGGGADLSYREVGSYTGTALIQAAVNVTINVVDQDNVAVATAQTSVYISSTNAQVMNEDTNGSGVATESYTGSTPVAVYIRVRKSSTGTTRYFPASTTSTIGTGGLETTIVIRTDPIVSA